tara:strand:+ start:112 stop:630 length:519 start_codon:yes stop_codon:yes gene_type:complete
MKIEIFDDTVDYVARNQVNKFCLASMFRLGWEDTSGEKNIKNLHSKWNLEDLRKCGLLPYIKECLKKSKNFKYDEDKIDIIELNLVKSDDVHYTHAHENVFGVLYYVNLNWEDGFYGETFFYNSKDLNKIEYASVFKPGRIIIFDGSIPHTIRPQSIRGPKFRFTISVFFKK